MNKIDWKRKLSSRKFWAGVAGAITMLLGIIGVTDNIVAQVSEIIAGAGMVIGAILGEATVDAARASNAVTEENGGHADDETF